MTKGEHKAPEFLAINPAGALPALKDGDLGIGEGIAIQRYILNSRPHQDSFFPSEARKRAAVDHVVTFEIGDLRPACLGLYFS